jgi:hypothetical protein
VVAVVESWSDIADLLDEPTVAAGRSMAEGVAP